MYRQERYENDYEERSLPRRRGYEEEDRFRGRTAPARRGFAAMSPEERREIAREGGRAAHAQGVAHEFTTEEAREAGRRGGQTVRGRRLRDEEFEDFEGWRGERGRGAAYRRGFEAGAPEERRETAMGARDRWEEPEFDEERRYAVRGRDYDYGYGEFEEPEFEDVEGYRQAPRQERSRRGFATVEPERRHESVRRSGEVRFGRGYH